MTNNNLLFLPVIRLNQNSNNLAKLGMAPNTALGSGTFLVACDTDTVTAFTTATAASQLQGRFINGTKRTGIDGDSNYIRTDQGLNTNKLDADQLLSAELKEQQYLIQIDNRLGTIYDVNSGGGTAASPAFIDDDQIASYYVTQQVGGFVMNCQVGPLFEKNAPVGNVDGAAANPDYEVIPGPRGSRLFFSVLASNNLRSSTFLFQTLGTNVPTPAGFDGNSYFVIDSTVKVTGVTTGYTIDIPVRFVRLND